MRVVVQKVDMDTALAGLLLGVGEDCDIVVRRPGATVGELADPAVLCLEAGGAGQVSLNNFDHHECGGPADPVCVQAARQIGAASPAVRRLVEYVASIDLGRPLDGAPPPFPTLSNLFSGVMLVHRADARDQLLAGMALFRRVLAEGIDPFGRMPDRPEWAAYLAAKIAAREGLSADMVHARFFVTRDGAAAGVVHSTHPGATGAIYEQGCRYAIAINDAFSADGGPGVRKATIAARGGSRVDHLLPLLQAREPGWGGPAHGTIIGSPREGTALSADTLLEMVREHCTQGPISSISDLDAWWKAHSADVRRIASRFGADARDLQHDAYLKLREYVRNHRITSPFGLVKKAVHDIHLDYLRRRGAKDGGPRELPAESDRDFEKLTEKDAMLAHARGRTSHEALRFRELVLEFLDNADITDAERQAFVFYWFEEFTDAEVARHQGAAGESGPRMRRKKVETMLVAYLERRGIAGARSFFLD